MWKLKFNIGIETCFAFMLEHSIFVWLFLFLFYLLLLKSLIGKKGFEKKRKEKGMAYLLSAGPEPRPSLSPSNPLPPRPSRCSPLPPPPTPPRAAQFSNRSSRTPLLSLPFLWLTAGTPPSLADGWDPPQQRLLLTVLEPSRTPSQPQAIFPIPKNPGFLA